MNHADVAQLVEHHLAKVRVAGSNPVVRSRSAGIFRAAEVCLAHGLPMVCPWPPWRSSMTGSLRYLAPGSWELRVYLGVDADTGRERWATKTVHGSRRHASSQLAAFGEEAGYARLRAGTVADLLDRWLAHASP